MAAMAMPYPVHDSKALAALSPGDQITADIVVTDNDTYLENIVVTKKGTGPANTTGPTHLPQPGEKVPDFALVNQDGKRIHLRSYQGDVLLVTFIYTRCPFPTFCPLVSRNFAQIYAQLRKDPAIGSKKIRLLSVSFDPKHDTPAVLKRYAETFNSTTGGNPFDRWEFAAVPAKGTSEGREFLRAVLQRVRRSDRPLIEHQRHFARWHHLQMVRRQYLEAHRSFAGCDAIVGASIIARNRGSQRNAARAIRAVTSLTPNSGDRG